MITLDLDYFKEVNDGEGHAAGDALLQVAGQWLRNVVRRGDMVACLGEDDLLSLLLGVSGRSFALAIANRITSDLPILVPFGSRRLRLSTTLGVAGVPIDTDDTHMVMRIADAAMVQAKRSQRSSIGCPSLDAAARARGSHTARL